MNKLTKYLCKLLGCCKPVVGFSVQVRSRKTTHKPMLEVKLTTEQEVDVALTPTTEAGQPAQLDGVPNWSIISGDGSVTPSDDGLSAIIYSENPGTTQILVEADADLGDGVETVSGIITLTVTGAKAKFLGLTVGEPRLRQSEGSGS